MFFIFFSLISLRSYNWWVHSISHTRSLQSIGFFPLTQMHYDSVQFCTSVMQPNHLYKSQIKPWDIKCWLFSLCLLHVCGTAMWYNWDDMQVSSEKDLFRKTCNSYKKKKKTGISENFLSSASFWQILVLFQCRF